MVVTCGVTSAVSVVVEEVADWAVSWFSRQHCEPWWSVFDLPEHGKHRRHYCGRIATVRGGIGAGGGHLRRDLGRVEVVVGVADLAVSWYSRRSGEP